MTAPAPRYLFVYSFPVRHSMVFGNAKARTEQEVRSIIAQEHGTDMADIAVVTLAAVEEPCSTN